MIAWPRFSSIVILASLWLTTASAAPAPAPRRGTPIGEFGKATTDVGQVFVQGKTDGLILYALVLLAFFLFLALVWTSWLNSGERKSQHAAQLESDKARAEANKASAAASLEASEALRDVATALASTSSANMTFQATMASIMARQELVLQRMEHPK